ncbi:unnamed protein product [Ilex paraguariensis]|uniref:Uncharacterized protein n=1 Tax=Ilex paraguariensis TaxID=185542 RepID=A0ABC8S4G4_9AQUA
MAGTRISLQPTHQPNPTLDRLFTAIDPKSLILSQFSTSDKPPQLLQLTTESFIMERGPRYKAYADLRESKLRTKNMKHPPQEPESDLTPPRKQVKFNGNLATPPSGRKKSSVLTQSVPDFSSALRKENRKPVNLLPAMMEKSVTPPTGSKYGKLSGSKSANSGEKRSGGLMARKSYASMEELKGFSLAAANAINGGKSGRGAGKAVLGCRQQRV